MKQRMFWRTTRTLILLGSAIAVFGCKAPLQDNAKGINMTTTAQKRAVEDILPKKAEVESTKDVKIPAKEENEWEKNDTGKKKIMLKPFKDKQELKKTTHFD